MTIAVETPQDRGLRTHAELGHRHEHGTRGRYLAGCKCFHCRRANSAYCLARIRAQQAGKGNPIIPATRVLEHLAKLRAAGVGYKTAARRAGVAISVVSALMAGRRKNCRKQSEEAILGVTADDAADGAYIDGAATWAMLEQLLRVMPKTEIARRLGSKAKVPSLQIRRDRVMAGNARKIAALHAELIVPLHVVHRLEDDEDGDE